MLLKLEQGNQGMSNPLKLDFLAVNTPQTPPDQQSHHQTHQIHSYAKPTAPPDPYAQQTYSANNTQAHSENLNFSNFWTLAIFEFWLFFYFDHF